VVKKYRGYKPGNIDRSGDTDK